MIELNNVGLEKKGTPILQNVSLRVRSGRFTVIAGRNGAGKSSLLNILSGEEKAFSGEVTLNGRAIQTYSLSSLAQMRAVLPQSNQPGFAFTVEQVVELGAFPFVVSGGKKRALISDILEKLDIARMRKREITTLSGGERQKVHFARVWLQAKLSPNPCPIVFLDEPANNLDITCQHEIFSLLQQECAQNRLSVVAIVHDINLAARYADDIIFLKSGRLLRCSAADQCLKEDILEEALGHPVTVLHHPCSSCPLIIPQSNRTNSNLFHHEHHIANTTSR